MRPFSLSHCVWCALALTLVACASVEGQLPNTEGSPLSPGDDPEAQSPFGVRDDWRAGPFAESHLFPPGFQIPVLNWFIQPPHFRKGDPDDPGRHVGLGMPLEGTSWLNRPYQVGWLWGSIYGTDLIQDRVAQGNGRLGGYRIGWDFDHYWGAEARFAFDYMEVASASGITLGSNENTMGDVHLLYYPWGDARWRPFVGAGIGFSRLQFQDDGNQPVDETLFGFPLTAGVKYLYRKWLALRITATDNLVIGGFELETQHNISVTGGVEVRFGGPRRSYYPYNASRHLW